MANVLTIRLGDTWEQMNAARNLSLYENKYFYVHANHKPEHLQTSDSYRDPVLGDLRISFDVTPAYPVTICAQQQLHELSPFVVTKTGEAVFLLEDGMHSVDELFNTKTATKVCLPLSLSSWKIPYTIFTGPPQPVLSPVRLCGRVHRLSGRSAMAAIEVRLWFGLPKTHFRWHQQYRAHSHCCQSELVHLQVRLLLSIYVSL